MNTKKGQFEPAEVGKLIEKHFSAALIYTLLCFFLFFLLLMVSEVPIGI
jgi:hypothetical protein